MRKSRKKEGKVRVREQGVKEKEKEEEELLRCSRTNRGRSGTRK